MARNVAIGIQQFDTLIEKNCFYVDKTDFIREWWESNDSVTLITRPRRFGKTLNMSMTEQFFSVDYADRGDLFEGLSIWKEEKYRTLQGTYPVISLPSISCRIICTVTMARRSLSCWMSMTRPCRKLLLRGSGTNWLLLPEVCLILHLRRTRGWSVPL